MRFDREHLVFKALCAVDEAVDDCESAPLRPTYALRFALAFLFAVSDGQRECYDRFWREISDTKDMAYSEHNRRYLRSTYARIAMTGIARGVGIEMTAVVMQRLRDARSPRNA